MHPIRRIATIAWLSAKIGWLLSVRCLSFVGRALLRACKKINSYRPFNPLWGVVVSLIVVECVTLAFGFMAEVSTALTVYSIFHTFLICGTVMLLIWFDSAAEREQRRRRRSAAASSSAVPLKVPDEDKTDHHTNAF